MSLKTIAFYLPQFYPTPENDAWWGPGFTEWTNVAKARPLFPGHYQPRIPSDLSFYDLRVPQVREQQAELAKQAGIGGFCYWHYWFAGRQLLDQVFSEVVESGNPDFPFCLCWANHSWAKKDFLDQSRNIMLLEQTYPGDEDIINHFNTLLPAFRDHRYMKVDGRLIFGVFDPFNIPAPQHFFDMWNNLAKQNGLDGFYFFGFHQGAPDKQKIDSLGFNAIVCDFLHEVYEHPHESKIVEINKRLKRKILGYPYTVDYDNYCSQSINFFKNNLDIVPCIDPDFDHSPRSGKNWIIIEGSTPEKWGRFYRDVRDVVERSSEKLLFIKAWNEWGEGNYLEPDMKYGQGYLKEMSKVSQK